MGSRHCKRLPSCRMELRIVSGKKWSVFALVMSSLAAIGILTESAVARPAICSTLERQLASGGGGGSSGFSRYARAAAAQGEQIAVARQQARRAGCGGSFLSIFGGNESPRSCKRIMSTISRMEANRSALLRKRDTLGGVSSSGSRRAILTALSANGCRGAKVVTAKAERRLPASVQDASVRSNSLFDQFFRGDEERGERKPEKKLKSSIQKVRRAVEDGEGVRREGNSVYIPMGPGGTVRTLCVRTCDGFYFPVSFSTTSDHFSKDVAACSAMCPGAETKIYYHSIPDEEPEQMVDLDGQRYMSTPTAFKYRVNGARSTPGCTCQAQEEAKLVSEPVIEDDTKKSKKAQKWIATPLAKPDRWIDPESAANIRGGLTSTQLADFLGKPDGTQATVSLQPGKIRVVGPAFLPAQKGAIEPQAPAQTSVR